MNVRRSAAVLAATVVIGTATPAMAADSSPSPSPSVALPSGLYGDSDPTYDGVWRQSLALIAQHRTKVKPADKAVDWLLGQQCKNGAFAAFRAEPAKACDAEVMVDTNSTAVAAQALSVLDDDRHMDRAVKAADWLKSVQNKDGGWGYTPGSPTDANSTSLVVGALAAVGQDPGTVVTGGKSPLDALGKLDIPCADGGGFAYQPDKKGKLTANGDATAAAVVGVLGLSMVSAQADDKAGTGCDDAAPAANGASYLAATLKKDGHLKSALAGSEDQPDYGNTADAVVALAVTGGKKAAQKPLTWLEQNSADWAKANGPAAYAQLVLAAEAAGADPRAFGGTDLVKQLNATGPAPKTETKAAAEEKKKDDEDGGVSVWWIIGVGLVGGIGVGFLISGRNKGRQA
ncbi:prenyltransferase/squalene oxidase repeat-containing protein [Streptomyces sp. TRM68416]|uniref:prenyltransferase/squalene oxidase repeat-containing protein n=1 Tax=Streptomyces sp. TRM68416 TaxID=2758412 RepID=UPI001661D777|nr:prenyltransferase/squalene oxidase repeat-containing protein [Streptomyces sp. TRM68416]MBD0837328.1 terpene cyclase/mutase family protein [Streptomyces sp. TRM68416]